MSWPLSFAVLRTRLDSVPHRYDREKFGAWMSSRALKNTPIQHPVSIFVGSVLRVLHSIHLGGSMHLRAHIQGTCNLIENVINRVPVVGDSTVINMPTQEKNLRTDGREIERSAYGIERRELRGGKFSDGDNSYPVSLPDFLKVQADKLGTVRV